MELQEGGSTVLEPELTKWDLKVLAAVPTWPVVAPGHDAVEEIRRTRMSAWAIAEAVRDEDVKYVRETLRGLQDRGLVYSSAHWEKHKQRWIRSSEGDRYLQARGRS